MNIKKYIINIIEIIKYNEFDENQLQQKIKAIGLVSLTASIIAFFMSYMNFRHQQYEMLIATTVLMLTLFIVFIFSRIFRTRKIVAPTLCFILSSICIFFTLTGGNDGFAILWTLLFTPFIMQVIGFGFGIIVSGFFLIFFIVLFWTPLNSIVSDYYTQTFMLRFPMLFTASFVKSILIKYFHIKMKIAEDKALMEAEHATATQSKFLANMSHEIRTPMNAIVGMSELLLSENMTSNQHRSVKDIHVSAIALLKIINDILDLSKIQTEKLELVPVHYDFNLFLDNIDSVTHFLIMEKDISFNMLTEGECPACLYGDDVRLRQVILNILGNAIKFTKKGTVSLIISADDTSITFVISDTGIGIPKSEIPILFDAFLQVDMKKNRSQEGTGLGLSITKTLVEMMNGSISVDSEYGKGTTFSVKIPKILGDEALIQQLGNEEIAIIAPDVKILVVDDNSINLNVATGLLQLYKIEAQTALSGSQAIEMISKNHYDLVFMDHMMPEMDGIEATKIIREMGVKLPIIALTANVIIGAKEEFVNAGMDDMLTKPISKSLLSQILKTWLPSEKVFLLEDEAVFADGDENPVTEEFWRRVEQIEGLSLEIGLERVSGQRDVYKKSLKLTIKEIEKCVKNLNVFLEAENMRSFSIEVHSMKGSLANIGVMALSGLAYKLETAADNKDAVFCAAQMPAFLKELDKLKQNLIKAFADNTQPMVPPEVTPELLSELAAILKILKDALNDSNFTVIDEEIARLDTLNPGGTLQEEIEKIKDAVMIMDYKEALEVMINCIPEIAK
ncbi:MAG: response regulator [Treponema sp.]|jgi:signal transduction histidine kinase/DNA-binding response OmpR family regulator|nr:response regulator [Treponema sp.]